MPKMYCGALLICGLLVGQVSIAQAKGLEEILQDKGVITAEEYREATKTSDLAYYKNGLIVESRDGNYKAKVGGYAQIIYRNTDVDDNAKSNKSDFDIRRFKLQLKGHVVNPRIGYKFQGEMASGFKTEDAYVNYRFSPALTVQIGQYKPPQARQELTSASKQLFPDRSLANDTFNLGRDQGLQVSGHFLQKKLEYRIGVFNGNGPNAKNPDNNNMYTGRIDINPLGAFALDESGLSAGKLRLNLGTSFSFNTISGDDVGNGFDKDNDALDKALNLDVMDKATFSANYGKEMELLVLTANIDFTWAGFTFAGEYYTMNADPDLGQDWNADGYYLQAGYQVLPQTLELGLRYAAIESDRRTATRLVSAEFEKSETQIGVNYYLSKHAAKLQADVTFVEDELQAYADDRIIRLQVQFYY